MVLCSQFKDTANSHGASAYRMLVSLKKKKKAVKFIPI